MSWDTAVNDLLFVSTDTQSLCQLAINYSKVVKQPGLADTSSSFLCSAQWGKSLGKLGVGLLQFPSNHIG